MTDVMIAGSVGVGWSRSGLVSFLFSSLSLSKVGSAGYDAVWVRGVDRCGHGHGSERALRSCFVLALACRRKSYGCLGGRLGFGSTLR
jgi:hypothetical protein